MRIAMTIAALALAGCVSPGLPGPAQDLKNEAITSAAVAGEIAVRSRCPRSNVELGILIGARTAFDLGVGASLPFAHYERVLAAREETNRVCGIVQVETPPTDPSPSPAPST